LSQHITKFPTTISAIDAASEPTNCDATSAIRNGITVHIPEYGTLMRLAQFEQAVYAAGPRNILRQTGIVF